MKITTFNNLDEITGNEGKILLYDEAKSKIGASTETVNEIIQDKVGGDISRLDDRVDTVESNLTSTTNTLSGAIALKADTDKVYTKIEVDEKFADFGGFEIAEGDSETGEPIVENPDVKKIYLVKKGTKKDKYCEWIWTKEEGSSENTWVLIGETTVELTDYAKTVDVDDALALKEDKVFVAEYNVTPYADIKAAYDAGKQIVCKYNYGGEFVYAQLEQYITYSVQPFIFNNARPGQDLSFTCINNNGVNEWSQKTKHYYDKTETSGTQQLTDAFNAKQDKLTFAGENNTITAINSSAIGGQAQTLIAGTDLVINNGVIGVNTNGTTGNPSEMSFVAGSGTYTSGIGSVAFGLETSAWGKSVFVEGHKTSAEGYYSHAEGEMTHASGYEAHAEGQKTSAYGSHTHAEGFGTIASGGNTHVEGANVSAFMENAHAEGYKTYINRGEKTDGVYYGAHAEGSATSAIGRFAHAEGGMCIASGGNSGLYGAHAEGGKTSAYGAFSHTEGSQTEASGEKAHAEGEFTSAFGGDSHAEGKWTLAKGTISHAEGVGTSAVGNFSHAGGYYTITTYTGTTVVGKYNKLDTNNSSTNAAFIVGNGANNIVRSDAFIVDWDGVASATKLATSGIADIETSITALQAQIGNIDSILQSI